MSGADWSCNDKGFKEIVFSGKNNPQQPPTPPESSQ
jgi:hypothetical protein